MARGVGEHGRLDKVAIPIRSCTPGHKLTAFFHARVNKPQYVFPLALGDEWPNLLTMLRTLRMNGAEAGNAAQKAKTLCDWLQSRATEIEAAKRIPEEVVERLAAAGLFRMMQPPPFGGLGCTPREAWEAVFEVGRGCGSCAWIVGLNSANILMLGKFSDQAQRDVFLCGKPAIVSMLTGGVGSGITVEPASGGVVVSGRWRYASGIDIASWAGLLVPLPGKNGGAPDPHVVLVPQDAFSIDHSSWNVLGMRGTGSKDISLKPTFVPEHRWLSWSRLQAGEKHPTCPNHEPTYDYPLNSIFAMSVLAPLLGVASAVAEEFREVVKTRVNSGTQQRQRESTQAVEMRER